MPHIPSICLLLICTCLLSGCGSLSKMKARAAMEAMNNGDIETYLQDWAEDAVFVYPGDVSTSGEIKGKKAITRWFENWRRMFPDLKFTIKAIYLKDNLYFGTTNVMAVHWEASGSNKFGKRVSSSGIGVITMKGTQISRVHDYIFDAHKLKEFWGE